MTSIGKRIVESEGAPNENELWLNPKSEDLKYFNNGSWKSISGGGSGSQETFTQVQADWNQTNNTKADYIKNKPSIPTVPGVMVVEGGLNGTSDFEPDSGQPTFEQAIAQLAAGGLVWLNIKEEEGDQNVKYLVVGYDTAPSDGSSAYLFVYTGDNSATYWFAPSAE